MSRAGLALLLLAPVALAQTPRDKELLELAHRYADPVTGPGDLTTIAARFRSAKAPYPARTMKKVLGAPAVPAARARQARLVVAGGVPDGWLMLSDHMTPALAGQLVAEMFEESSWPRRSLLEVVRGWARSAPTSPEHEPLTAGFVAHPNIAAQDLESFAKELDDEASRAAAARILAAVLELPPGLSTSEVAAEWAKRRAEWQALAGTDYATMPEEARGATRIESAPTVLFRGDHLYLRAGVATMFAPPAELDDKPHEVLIRFRALKPGFRLGYGGEAGYFALTFGSGRLTYSMADHTERWLECSSGQSDWHTLRFEVTPDIPADGRFQRRRGVRILLDDKPFDEQAHSMNGPLGEAFADADDTGGEVLVAWVAIRRQ